jgi:cell division protein FtsB
LRRCWTQKTKAETQHMGQDKRENASHPEGSPYEGISRSRKRRGGSSPAVISRSTSMRSNKSRHANRNKQLYIVPDLPDSLPSDPFAGTDAGAAETSGEPSEASWLVSFPAQTEDVRAHPASGQAQAERSDAGLKNADRPDEAIFRAPEDDEGSGAGTDADSDAHAGAESGAQYGFGGEADEHAPAETYAFPGHDPLNAAGQARDDSPYTVQSIKRAKVSQSHRRKAGNARHPGSSKASARQAPANSPATKQPASRAKKSPTGISGTIAFDASRAALRAQAAREAEAADSNEQERFAQVARSTVEARANPDKKAMPAPASVPTPADSANSKPGKRPAAKRPPAKRNPATLASASQKSKVAAASEPKVRTRRPKMRRDPKTEAARSEKQFKRDVHKHRRERERTIERSRRQPKSLEQRLVVMGATVILAVLTVVILYPPAQGLYSAVRIRDYHAEQLETVNANNARMQERVDSLQTQEGIQDEARERYGLVLPGETLGVVSTVGADDSTSDAASDANAEGSSGTASTTSSSSGTSSAAQQDSGEQTDSWATRLLDSVFGVSLPNDTESSSADPQVIKEASPNAVVDQESDGQTTQEAASGDEASTETSADIVVNENADVVVGG